MPTYRTLKQLRDELSVRLGFGAQNGQINAPLLNSFLRSANAQIWLVSDWLHGRKDFEVALTTPWQFMAYPTDCEPGFISSISVKVSGKWVPLFRGIDDVMRSAITAAPYPTRYDENANDAGLSKIEFWPVSTQNSTIRINFEAQPTSFVKDTDRASVPDEMVFMHALVNAKLHYRQPDGQGYASQLDNMMDAYKSRHFGKKVFSPGEKMLDPYLLPPA